jgi:thiol:disulfide interchange protein DsbD
MKSKLIFLFFCYIISTHPAKAQIHWEVTSKKLTNSIFEVHLTAVIKNGWHIYSQVQPSESIVTPLEIIFDKSPEMQFLGGTKEIGNREERKGKVTGTNSYEYRSLVDFVQTVKIIENTSISLKGNVTFMLCSEDQCLPPETKTFAIQL